MSLVTTSKRAPKGTARRALDDAMSEDQWSNEVLAYARQGGWMAFHPKPASVIQRGRYVRLTHYEGDKGFPDWTFARGGVVLFVELKAESGQLAPEQRAWLAAVGSAGRVWRPRDREVVRATLLEGVQVAARNLPA